MARFLFGMRGTIAPYALLDLMLDTPPPPPVACPTAGQVVHPYFRTPNDGMWCILLDGVEVGKRTSVWAVYRLYLGRVFFAQQITCRVPRSLALWTPKNAKRSGFFGEGIIVKYNSGENTERSLGRSIGPLYTGPHYHQETIKSRP